MKSFIQDLLARASEYSKSLDKLSDLQDYPWVMLTEEGEKVKYIFRRDGSLLMVKRGNVEFGKWEYLLRAESLLITANGKSRLLNQGFLDENALILKVDGTEELMMFANQAKLPDLNPEQYLVRLVTANSPQLKGTDTSNLSVPGPTDSKQAVKEPKKQQEGIELEFKIDKGETLKILTLKGLQSEKGCPATIGNKSAPDGSYRISAFQSIQIKDGKTV